MRRLEHPNVLRFIGVLYKERKLHLITEYVKGGSLRELIQNVQHSLSWTIRCRIVHDISCGMAYLHSMGVIHRDLSSHNCLVREVSINKIMGQFLVTNKASLNFVLFVMRTICIYLSG